MTNETPGVRIKIPEWVWEKYAAIARALNVDAETLIVSALANALAPFHVVELPEGKPNVGQNFDRVD
jgi:hypothetical protein